MELDLALSTTRTIRRGLDFDREVAPELIRECLSLARYAPSGANRQDWRFLVLDDPELIAAVGELYRQSSVEYLAAAPALAASADGRAIAELAGRMGRAPVLVLACVHRRLAEGAAPVRQSGLYGSIYPALWSFLLAARGRGLGAALTTAHLAREREVAELLGIPFEQVTQVALVAVAHLNREPPGPARRQPLEDVMAYNGWRW